MAVKCAQLHVKLCTPENIKNIRASLQGAPRVARKTLMTPM